ncbi:MAG TPA: phosphoribosylformylglycinamidine cyclo-ligase [Clostridiales bacterium]|nr:phosphoribosylformylglycinamidine cyclo-ligase [Clostridiales bacterium]
MGRGFTYKDAGVDIGAGEEAVERIRGHVSSTVRPGVLGGIGGFGGLFHLARAGYRDPVLVSACDGVGTKLKVAIAAGVHDTVGQDLVAMCANDVLVQGAEPLFFLDYIALGRLVPSLVEEIVSGIAAGCREAGCALIGGETAEMPDMYPEGSYDLAGFCVGALERGRELGPDRVRAGDVLLGLPSSGLHSNGFSLVRKVLLGAAGWRLDAHVAELGCTLVEELLRPTVIYRRTLEVSRREGVHAMAHVTGGGIPGNLVRVLRPGLRAVVDTERWAVPPIFRLVQEVGRVPEDEMYRTFNMGIGMIMVVAEERCEEIKRELESRGQPSLFIGQVIEGGEAPTVELF